MIPQKRIIEYSEPVQPLKKVLELEEKIFVLDVEQEIKMAFDYSFLWYHFPAFLHCLNYSISKPHPPLLPKNQRLPPKALPIPKSKELHRERCQSA